MNRSKECDTEIKIPAALVPRDGKTSLICNIDEADDSLTVKLSTNDKRLLFHYMFACGTQVEERKKPPSVAPNVVTKEFFVVAEMFTVIDGPNERKQDVKIHVFNSHENASNSIAGWRRIAPYNKWFLEKKKLTFFVEKNNSTNKT